MRQLYRFSIFKVPYHATVHFHSLRLRLSNVHARYLFSFYSHHLNVEDCSNVGHTDRGSYHVPINKLGIIFKLTFTKVCNILHDVLVKAVLDCWDSTASTFTDEL